MKLSTQLFVLFQAFANRPVTSKRWVIKYRDASRTKHRGWYFSVLSVHEFQVGV